MNGNSSVPLQRAVRSLVTSKERVGGVGVGLWSCWSVASTCSHLPPFVSIWLVPVLFSQTVTIVAKRDLVFQFRKGHIHKCHTYQILSRFGCQKNICLLVIAANAIRSEKQVTSHKLVKKTSTLCKNSNSWWVTCEADKSYSQTGPLWDSMRFRVPSE